MIEDELEQKTGELLAAQDLTRQQGEQIVKLRVDNAHLRGQLEMARQAAEYWRERHEQLREKKG